MYLKKIYGSRNKKITLTLCFVFCRLGHLLYRRSNQHMVFQEKKKFQRACVDYFIT